MMQQAVASSSQLTLPLSLNRNVIQQRLRDVLQDLTKLLSQDVPLESPTTDSLNKNNNKLEKTKDILIDLLSRQTPVVLDSLIKSFSRLNAAKCEENVTFFENRFGFTSDELLNCEYNEEPLLCFSSNDSTRKFLNSINSKSKLFKKKSTNIYTLHTQIRGFKTKRVQSLTDEKSSKDIFDDYISKRNKPNPNKIINSLLASKLSKNTSNTTNASSSSSSSAKLGSIFSQTPAASNDIDLESKLKVAFAEGVLYGKHDEKKHQPSSFLRFLFFVSAILLITILFPVSFTTSSNGSNGSSGGINIRALTGSINYEVNPEQVNVKFDDVKGLPEAKKELAEIVDFLRDPEKYTKLGARLPKGILLIGPPGCGKTLLAKSVAGEAGVPYFQASGSDFDEMFVGTGSKRVRQLFAAARAKAPCVIFIDEIDSVGSTRTNSAIHPHANQTINQLLAEMDGFQKNEGVIVLGATNRRETLDSALMRPGRFDVEVRIDKPDLNQRIEILEYYLDKVARDDDIDVKYLAKQLTGLGGSSIENVVNQAALRAVISNSKTVKMDHLEWALDRALMGYGKSRIQDEECNKNTAYHEAGHVLVAYYTKDSDPLHKVTILPRSQSLGHTAFVPEDEGYSKTKSQLLAQMDVAMGGRVAEEFAFGGEKITTGASSDFKKATQIAVQMIKIFGMNDKVGIRVYDNDKLNEDLSPQTQEILDQEIKKTLNDSYERARNIIKTHSTELKLIADALLKHETLDVDQIKKIIDQKVII